MTGPAAVIDNRISHPPPTHADVAELADALDSGSSSRKGVEVQVLSSAPIKSISYRDSDALHRRAFSRWCDYSVTNFEFRSVGPCFGVTVSVTPGGADGVRMPRPRAAGWRRSPSLEGMSWQARLWWRQLRLVVAAFGFFVLGPAPADVLVQLLGCVCEV